MSAEVEVFRQKLLQDSEQILLGEFWHLKAQ